MSNIGHCASINFYVNDIRSILIPHIKNFDPIIRQDINIMKTFFNAFNLMDAMNMPFLSCVPN